MEVCKLSVIIPVYNAQNHIKKCLDSILEQVNDKCEVLVMNDGSTDASEDILQEYQQRYPKLVRVISQKNEGVAKTRNLGIIEAQGEYVSFIDNDDFVDPGYLNAFYQEMQHGYDIVIGGYRRVTSDRIQFQVKPKDSQWYKYVVTAPWAKMYKRVFLLENHIEFLDYGLGEDVYFSLTAYACTDKIKIIDYIGYNWYFNAESVSNTSQKGFNASLNPVYLLQKIYDRIGNSKREYSYFYTRYGVWYLLFSGRNASLEAFLQEYKQIFKWYEQNGIRTQFPLLGKATQGDSFSTRLIVNVFLVINQLNLVPLFARWYCSGEE